MPCINVKENHRKMIIAKSQDSTTFQTGDKVHSKRVYSNLWEGLGTVIGSENKEILVNNGGT